jgi:hypothetical protein
MSSKSTTFIDLCLAGEVDPSTIDEHVAAWHQSDTELTIAEFLGMTEEEYAAWVEEPWTLRFILFARAQKLPLSKALQGADAGNVAARCSNLEEAHVLQSWLRRTGRV